MILRVRPDDERSGHVVVVVCGYWGKNLIRNFAELGVLVGVLDDDRAVAESFLQTYPQLHVYSSLDEVLSDPEVRAIVVATPAATQGAVVERALTADKDVFVEKPLALSLERGEKLVRIADERGRLLMVGHLLWYHPAVLRLRDLIASGELGRIQYVYSNRLKVGKIRREENILWSFAPHDISVILGLVGERPVSIEASGGNYLYQNVADVTVSLLGFPSGVKAHIFVSWLHPYKEQKLVVVGDKKLAVFDDMSADGKLALYPHSIEWKDHLPVANRAEADIVPVTMEEPLRNECRHFLECIETRQRPRNDGREGLRVLQVLQSCQDSLASTAKDSTPRVESIPEREYFAHATAEVDEGVEIGAGTKIWHVSHIITGSRVGRNCNIGQNVVIGPRAVVGNGCKIQNNVSIYQRVVLEDEVFCGPSMVFTNVINPRSAIVRKHEYLETLVRRGATLGANCTIVCGVTIG